MLPLISCRRCSYPDNTKELKGSNRSFAAVGLVGGPQQQLFAHQVGFGLVLLRRI